MSKEILDMPRFYKDLEAIVNIDSGSYDAEGVNKVQDWFEGKFTKVLGWKATAFYSKDNVVGRGMLYSKTDDHNFDLLVLCHVDTVFGKGEAAKRPFKIEQDELKGPGVSDMKAGCLLTFYALEELAKTTTGNIGVFMNSDEEISSAYMREHMESIIKNSRIVIGAEPARPNGSFVKRRKGIARFDITFEGIAAHSGNNPYGGACAVEELAHWVLKIKSFDNKEKGLSINTGIIKGGSAANSIPDHAELTVSARMEEYQDALDLEKSIRSIQAFNPKVKVNIKGGIRRPPMVPDKRTEMLCDIVEKIGKNYGIDVTWTFAGGGSDASFATPLEKPALCGLSPMYRDSHTADEALLLKEIHERYGLFRDIIKNFSLLRDENFNV